MSYQKKEQRKQDMLQTMLSIYVSKGLENTSMRDIAAALNVSVSTLYDYFKSKENIVIETARYYMEQLEDEFLKKHKNLASDLKTEVKLVYDLLVGEKENLRFIYQVISSPLYGERGRKELEGIYTEYFKFSNSLARSYGIDEGRFEEAFMLFIATVHDFCLWDNEDFANKKLKCIYYLIDKELER